MTLNQLNFLHLYAVRIRKIVLEAIKDNYTAANITN